MVRRTRKIEDAKEIYDDIKGNKIVINDWMGKIEREGFNHVKKVFRLDVTKFRKDYDIDIKSTKSSDFLDYFNECNRDKKTNYYVWIGINSDDLVVVVGKAQFSKEDPTTFGDLFDDYLFWGVVTQELIMNLVSTKKEMDTLIAIEKKVNSFISKAIVLSLDVTSKSEASKVEAEVGNFLLNNKEKKIAILNKDSHNYP